MDKTKTYEELLNRTLDSLKTGLFFGEEQKEAKKLYDDIKKALSEPKNETDDEWISVEDRLPETNAIGIAHILAYDKCEGIVKADYFDASANYINGSNIFEISNTSAQLYKVTHWQPLPKSPKGE